MVVMMENKDYGEVVGLSDQPYINSLADHYGLATKSYAMAHPSLPNYLALVSGSTQGVTDDDNPSSHTFSGVQTLADQLSAAGYSRQAYAESLPSNPLQNGGATDSDGNPLYAVRHVPWEYFPNTAITLKNSTSMVSDLNSSSPPDFVWYTPNLIDDEHDGTVEQGNAFMASFIPEVQATSWYRAGGKIIIEWDEGEDSDTSGLNGGSGGHIPTIVVSAALGNAPVTSATPVDTIGVLRSIEDVYGLGHLGGAANAANGSIDALLSGGTTTSASRKFTTTPRASAVVGHPILYPVIASGSPTPRLHKKGKLPRGVHFRNNHNGTGVIWGTPKAKVTPGTYVVTIEATYGHGKSKQIMSELFTLTVSG